MADVIKILGQLSAAAATTEKLYTVPASTQAMISTLSVCNRTSSPVSFRVNLAVHDVSVTEDAVMSDKGYLFYDAPLDANSTMTATIGMTLGAKDIVRTYASSTGLSFNLFGVETS